VDFCGMKFFKAFVTILKMFSLRKLWLWTLLKISYELSKFKWFNARWGRYIALSIEPVNVCNLSCIECPTGTQNLSRAKGKFSLIAFENLLHQKAKDLWYLNFYFQGEPFLNSDLPKMIQLASKENIFTSVSTNGMLLNSSIIKNILDSGLHRIIFSVDGTSQEIYEKYRVGGELNVVISQIKEMVRQKKTFNQFFPIIQIQFLVFKHNQHQIDQIKKLGKTLGVDSVQIKSAQIYDYNQKEELIPSISKYSRYQKNQNGEWDIKSSLARHCWRMWHSTVVTQDLDVIPCCYDKDAQFVLGNLKTNDLSQIENNNLYSIFRHQIKTRREQIDMCRNCTEGLKL